MLMWVLLSHILDVIGKEFSSLFLFSLLLCGISKRGEREILTICHRIESGWWPFMLFQSHISNSKCTKKIYKHSTFTSVLLFWIFDCEVLLTQGIKIKLNIFDFNFSISVKEIGMFLHKLKYTVAMKWQNPKALSKCQLIPSWASSELDLRHGDLVYQWFQMWLHVRTSCKTRERPRLWVGTDTLTIAIFLKVFNDSKSIFSPKAMIRSSSKHTK